MVNIRDLLYSLASIILAKKLSNLQSQINQLIEAQNVLRKENQRLRKQLGGDDIVFEPIPGSSPRIDKQTPSLMYLDGQMPTYEIEDLIEHLEYRSMIHETYIGLVQDDPVRWKAFGTYAFHEWAIEGYGNCVWYLKELL